MSAETSWTRVVQELDAKTRSQSLVWEEGRIAADVQAFVVSVLRSNQARSFTANVGKAVYELSAGDAFGKGPYELKIWEERDGRRHAITALNSQVRVGSDYGLGQALQGLYLTVDSVVEHEEETAGRLLRDLENL